MNGIESVGARIGAIDQRFSPVEPSDQAAAPLRVLDSGPAFEAFGEVYQKAVASRDLAPVGAAVQPLLPMTGFSPYPALGASSAAMYSNGTPVASGAAVTNAINGVAAGPGERPVGGYGRMPVPAAVLQYGNGRIPGDALTPLAGSPGHKLYAPAAASWNNLVATARADGIELKITDSYRGYDEQVDLVRRKGLYSEGGLAAKPGTSNHGWGLAVDANVNDPRTLQWLKVNGPRFGWVESVPREPWHWEFRPDQV